MERRRFLLSSLLALPAATFARFNSSRKTQIAGPPKKGFIVRAGESRFFGVPTSAQNTYGRCIISSADTDSQLYLSSFSSLSTKEKGGPTLHIHYKDDELFYVVSGELLFQLGAEVLLAKAGDTVFIPRGTPHTFANPIENNPGNLINIHQPISRELEKFYKVFCEIGYMSEEQIKSNFTTEEIESLFANNPIVGPSIDVDAALAKLR